MHGFAICTIKKIVSRLVHIQWYLWSIFTLGQVILIQSYLGQVILIQSYLKY